MLKVNCFNFTSHYVICSFIKTWNVNLRLIISRKTTVFFFKKRFYVTKWNLVLFYNEKETFFPTRASCFRFLSRCKTWCVSLWFLSFISVLKICISLIYLFFNYFRRKHQDWKALVTTLKGKCEFRCTYCIIQL